MRQAITGLAAALAVIAASAAPAMACGGEVYYASGCSRGLFTSGVFGSGYGYNESYGYERLPDPSPVYYGRTYGPQYYYVNQGPTYSGPANFAPAPTYQERAVNGWRGYDRGYYYGYSGGPYGNATSHYYDGMPAAQGPVVYRYSGYRAHRHSMRYGYRAARYGYGHGMRAVLPRHGYAPRFYGPRVGMHGPRMTHMPRYAGPTIRRGYKPHYMH